ncbi:MAG: VanZ family protein [Chloroflexota bacterium]
MMGAWWLIRIAYSIPSILWMALIFALSSRQTLPPPPGVSFSTGAIIGHFSLYFVLTVLLAVAFSGALRPNAWAIFAAAVAASFYGISDEFHQAFVPGRSATLFDVIVDASGAFSAAAFILLASNRLRSRESP